MTRPPEIRERLASPVAGRLVNDLRALATTVDKLPAVEVSADLDDNYLLALAAAGAADFLVTGDRTRPSRRLARDGVQTKLVLPSQTPKHLTTPSPDLSVLPLATGKSVM